MDSAIILSMPDLTISEEKVNGESETKKQSHTYIYVYRGAYLLKTIPLFFNA